MPFASLRLRIWSCPQGTFHRARCVGIDDIVVILKTFGHTGSNRKVFNPSEDINRCVDHDVNRQGLSKLTQRESHMKEATIHIEETGTNASEEYN